jgi:hypothetical protein
MRDAPSSLFEGEVVHSRYRVERLLDSGSFGQIYVQVFILYNLI